MKYKLQVRSYKRIFKKPLVTSRCVLKERDGLIVRLENDLGAVGFGEVAPMHFLGSESFEEARAFFLRVGAEVDLDSMTSIDLKLPCCRFGIRAALEMLEKPSTLRRQFEVAALLSLGDGPDLTNYKDYRTFKCKIGCSSFSEEKEAFRLFYEMLPEGANLRLDANGAFSLEEAKEWLKFLDDYRIQFLEQPLPKGQEPLMAELAGDYQTPIALDESVLNGDDFQNVCESGWPFWMVIKPLLMGDVDRFKKLREQCDLPIVYSSVFETAIGVEAALALAASDRRNNYALGFGTIDYFLEDRFGFHQKGPNINSWKMTISDFKRIWGLCKKVK